MQSINGLPTTSKAGSSAEVSTDRKWLQPGEVAQLLSGLRKHGRHGPRDYCLALLMFRHGLRVSELCALQWHDVDMTGATIHIRRLKGSRSGVHPLRGVELRALRALPRSEAPWVFTSERGGPMTRAGVWALLARRASSVLGFHVHPHMLRHSCGYALVNEGADIRTIQHYLGHKQISNTVLYTELNASAFRDVFRE